MPNVDRGLPVERTSIMPSVMTVNLNAPTITRAENAVDYIVCSACCPRKTRRFHAAANWESAQR